MAKKKAADVQSPQEVEAIRAELIGRKRRLADSVGHLSGEGRQDSPRTSSPEISSLPQHLAELGTEAFEQDRDLGLAEQASAEIAEIDRALERLDAGTYGTCESCGRRISRERLRALPFAALCTSCKAKQEAA